MVVVVVGVVSSSTSRKPASHITMFVSLHFVHLALWSAFVKTTGRPFVVIFGLLLDGSRLYAFVHDVARNIGRASSWKAAKA
jgi:hypothetical protein